MKVPSYDKPEFALCRLGIVLKKSDACICLGATSCSNAFWSNLIKLLYNESISIISTISLKPKTRSANKDVDHVVMRGLNWETPFLQEISRSLMTAFAVTVKYTLCLYKQQSHIQSQDEIGKNSSKS